MTVKFCFILFVGLLASSPVVNAQKRQNIIGILLDSASKQTIPYVTVNLKNASGVSLKSTYTKDDGSFILDKLAPGKYLVTLAAIAYSTKIIQVDFSDGTKLTVDLTNILYRKLKYSRKK